jgi:hypothetical protein
VKRILTLFLASYYVFGTFCLPLGDFSVLQDVPAMYRYCKSTEQPGMNLMGFVTGHLLNIDGVFDHRDHHNTQKPHPPLPKHHPHSKVVGLVAFFYPSGFKFNTGLKQNPTFSIEIYLSDYLSDIFHPPTV